MLLSGNSYFDTLSRFPHFIGQAVFLTVFILIGCTTENQPHQNPIQIENQNPGTTDWLLTNSQTDTCRIVEPYEEIFLCRSKPIEGYCSATSIQQGETLEVFVSTDPPSSFTVDIYRMGYYQGKGGRKMQSLGPFNGKAQPVPEDGSNNLRECQWEKSFEIEIPDSWTSGVYLGKMTAETTGLESYIVFIVKDDRPADFLFQCSDLTWQAYNRWPEWRSLYDWVYEGTDNHNPWHVKVGADVSFDRPYAYYMNSLPAGLNPLTNGSGEFLLWEFPLAFWMESLGYDLTYISNLDTHQQGSSGLLRAKGFLSVGHDEYWTQQMLENVSEARDQGLNLLFLSGNSVFGKIGLQPSNIGVQDRIFGRIEWFPDEQELMGASSYGVGLADWVCTLPEHWIFQGTDLKKGDAIPDLVGWEYHGYPLKDMENLQVLAEGPMFEPDSGNLYAATYYELEQGNFVFNAATCWWSMLLSTPPGFTYPQNPKGLFTDRTIDFRKNDPRVQKMTQNMLDRIAGN